MKIPNLTSKQKCWTCEDGGAVEIQSVPWPGSDGTMMAPCPYCERGIRLEFSGRWGTDGFWKGESLPEQKIFPELPMARAEQMQRVSELRAMLELKPV